MTTRNVNKDHINWTQFTPVNVELVNILTILELTGGRDSNEPAKIKSIVRSSIDYDERNQDFSLRGIAKD